MKIFIKTESLRAAVLVASTKGIRQYLNGVQVLARDGRVLMRATDGAIAFEDLMPEQDTPNAEFIIPIESAKLIAKNKSHTVAVVRTADGQWECAGVVFSAIDGVFPNVDRVMPARNTLQPPMPSQFDGEQLAQAQQAMRVATGSKRGYFRLQHGNPALMHCVTADYPRCAIMALNIPAAFSV